MAERRIEIGIFRAEVAIVNVLAAKLTRGINVSLSGN
jgi:hypothetical protein